MGSLDVSPNNRVLSRMLTHLVCSDGWFIADFCLLNRPPTGLGKKQTWLNLDSAAEDYGGRTLKGPVSTLDCDRDCGSASDC